MAMVHMPGLRKSLGVDKAVHPRGKHGEGGTEEVDGEIFLSVSERVLSRAEEPQDRIPEGEADHKQDQGGTHQKGYGLAEDQLRALFILRPSGHGKEGDTPGGEQIGKGGDQSGQRKGQPDARQRRAAHHRADGRYRHGR